MAVSRTEIETLMLLITLSLLITPSTSTSMNLSLISSSKCFDGEQRVYSHFSKTLDCETQFGIYLPLNATNNNTNSKFPVLYYLSGLTSTHEHFIHRSGMQQYAAKYGIIVVNPDTSPRNVIAGEDDERYFGSGASFYLDATVEPWSKHYKMFSYVTRELPNLINSNFPTLPTAMGISGFSMGGHGALVCSLKNPGLYKSVSAFAPVTNLKDNPVGPKIFSGYLGDNQSEWEGWDATYLAKKYSDKRMEIFIDMGSADPYLEQKHLLPENFLEATSKNENLTVIYKLREGYDHSYFFLSTFIEEHFAYHAKYLKQ